MGAGQDRQCFRLVDIGRNSIRLPAKIGDTEAKDEDVEC